MNVVTKPPSPARAQDVVVASGSGAPDLPQWLDQAIVWWVDPEKRPYRRALNDAERAVAAQAARAFDVGLAPRITRGAVEAWIRPLAASVAQAPPTEAYQGRINAVMDAAAGLPLAVLNPATYAAAVRAFRFWPSGAEIVTLLETHARQLLDKAEALKAISRPPHPSSSPHAGIPKRVTDLPTDAERDAVADLVRKLTGRSVSDTSPAPRAEPVKAPPAKAAPVSPAILRAMYMAQTKCGLPEAESAARTRLEVMDAQEKAAAERGKEEDA